MGSRDFRRTVPMKRRRAPARPLLDRLKRHRIVALLVGTGTLVVALASFTDAAKMLVSLVLPQRPDEARVELARRAVPYTPAEFAQAAARGDAAAVKLFVAAGMPPDQPAGPDDTTPLVAAARAGHLEVASLLLKALAGTPQQRAPQEAAALAAAAAHGQTAIVELLLDHKPHIDALGRAFALAAANGQPQLARLLWDRGAKAAQRQSAALHEAAANHREPEAAMVSCVQLLLDLGADIHRADGPNAWTPLHQAAASGHTAVVQALLQRGADPRLPDKEGGTPLYWAAGTGRREAAAALLDQGADANARAHDGTTPLWRAAYNNDPAMVELLLSRGADVNAGTSALLAVPVWEVGRALLDKGADVNARSKDGLTVLMMYAHKGSTVGLQALLDRGAQIDAVRPSGETALMLAAAAGHVETVGLLLMRGARPDLRDAGGKTALQWAQTLPAGDNRGKLEEMLRPTAPASRGSRSRS
jgi:ankyrin repeat protein